MRSCITDNLDGWGFSLNLWIDWIYQGKGMSRKSTFNHKRIVRQEKSASVLHQPGMVGEYVKGEGYYDKVLAITKELGDRRTEVTWNVELGNMCRSVRQHAKAKIYYEKALEIAMEIGHRENKIWCNTNLGNVLQPIGELAKAIEYHERALAIAKDNLVPRAFWKCPWLWETGKAPWGRGCAREIGDTNKEAVTLAT